MGIDFTLSSLGTFPHEGKEKLGMIFSSSQLFHGSRTPTLHPTLHYQNPLFFIYLGAVWEV